MSAPRPNWFIGYVVDPEPWYAERVGKAPLGCRRFHPEDLHFTVAFLGRVDEDAARAAWAAVHFVPAFDITLSRLVFMGAASYSALVEDGRIPLETWMGQTAPALRAAAGCRPDRRPPKAHCTIGRMRRKADDFSWSRASDWAAGIDLRGVPLRLDTLALYTWSTYRENRLFRIVAQRRRGVPLYGQ